MESSEQKPTNKIETEAWNRLTAVRGEGGMKEGEGISQGTHMHNPQTQTIV